MTTKIQWTTETWNYIVGCSEIRAGCNNCYAKQLAQSPRLAKFPQYQAVKEWDGTVVLVNKAIDIPLLRKKQCVYFVNSMSDLYHENVPEEWIDMGFGIMAMCPQHTFQILTKRHNRMQEYLHQPRLVLLEKWYKSISRQYGLQWEFDDSKSNIIRRRIESTFDGINPTIPLPNVWMGVSVENQKAADSAIPTLINTKAAIRFLSCEPLLEKIDITHYLGWRDEQGKTLINWVIVGGESGLRSRPCNFEWIEDIVNQCYKYNVPVFVKQLGKNSNWKTKHPQGGDINEFPKQLKVREFPFVDALLP
ncbi:DUF5131 family protein [Iningainema tapete]|uniref:DUF5131 family protein n=1 Tax=Iningainema tapete BLCC-T55 TaxID=2748662 RepID=A0A8J6XIQ3_9CYAN|nr:DUF5131 family protein [Iningainema tapete]MBD2772144.1 DUF5131 family protein [Iningainema tapete BLCC-T55]